MQAYMLTDRGTYLSRVDRLELAVSFEGDPALINPYAIIAISPEKYPYVNHAGANRLIEWVTSARGQTLIEEYRVNGKQLFHLFE
jgi:tungstate transport system substrate-binding protein